jgi:acyl dehydratase
MAPEVPAPSGTSTSKAVRWFEDYPQGAVFEFGSATISADEIITFARQYDPQAMHVDTDWAAEGPFGEVIASGWHTIAVMMRMFVEQFLPENGLAAPGIDEVRWPRPVRPGDTLRVRVTVLEARRSRSKPDRGLVQTLVEVFNQKDEIVLTMKPMNLVRCRPDTLAAAG